MKTKIAIAFTAVLLIVGCGSQGNYAPPAQQVGNNKVCDAGGNVYPNEAAAARAGLAPAQYGATYCQYRNTQQDKVCDQFGNVYNSAGMAERAGLSPAQYGASYCK